MNKGVAAETWRLRFLAELERCFLCTTDEHRALRPEIMTESITVDGDYPALRPVIRFRFAPRLERLLVCNYGEISWLIDSLEHTEDDAEVAAHVVWANLEEQVAAVEHAIRASTAGATECIDIDTLPEKTVTSTGPETQRWLRACANRWLTRFTGSGSDGRPSGSASTPPAASGAR